MVLGVLSLGSLLVFLDVTVVNIAVNELGEKLHAPLSEVQWVITGYLLALGLMLPITGWASNRVGEKRLWMCAIAVFVAASGLAAASWSLGALIAFRVVQGAAGGVIAPLGHTLAVRAAGGRSLARVISTLNVPILAGPMFGPALGGGLIDAFGWRSIFLINVPLGLLALVLGRRVLPAVGPGSPSRLDVRGLLLLSPGVVLLMFGATRLGHPDGPALLAAGMLLLALFWRHAHHLGRRAILWLTILRPTAARRTAVAMFAAQMLHFGTLALLPLYFLLVHGTSTLGAGVLVGVQGVGSLAAMVLVGRMSDAWGTGRLAQAGLALTTLATIPLIFVTAVTPYPALVAVLFVRGFGIGSTLTPLYALVYETVQGDAIAHATTILNTLARVGASFGVAIVLLVTNHQVAHADGRTGTLASAMGMTFAFAAVGTALTCALTLTIREPAAQPAALSA